LSDIEYLQIKSSEGKLRSNEGFSTVVGDLATLEANVGKDMYLASAKCTLYLNSDSINARPAEVVLKVNDVIKETTNATLGVGGSGGSSVIQYEFKNIGHKVIAGQIIKLEIISLSINIEVEGFIECNEEDTGISPQIPSI